MSLRHINFIIIGCLFIFNSCQWFENKKPEFSEVLGIYKFEYPSGEIEVIKLNSDSTYSQKIYKNNDDFKKVSNEIYSNSNKWKLNNYKIEFEHWLNYCDFNDPKIILLNPYYTSGEKAYWVAPNKEHNAILDFFYDNNYWYRKIY